MKKKKPTRGGSRPGSGRPAVEDPKIALTFSIRTSKKEQAKAEILPIVERINAE